MLDQLTAELVKVRASGKARIRLQKLGIQLRTIFTHVATRAPAGLSSHCSANASLWLTSAVLVYDIAVEAYCPWRVMRQFGQRQEFPVPTALERFSTLGSYIRVESNDSSSSTFVGCQGVACRAQLIGSP